MSAREVVSSIIREPLLVEMLFCPLMFYGSAREHDMDWGQFSIMFRSIFLEGLGRPAAGVRLILKHLVRKFRALGGELKLRSGVKRLVVENGRVTRVVLENDEEIEGRYVVSSAGWCETMRMCDDGQPVITSRSPGQLTFCETIATLDAQPSDLGHDRTITFFNDHDKFIWQKPEELCDVRSGVICSPNNFAYDSPLDDCSIRITALANFDRWRSARRRHLPTRKAPLVRSHYRFGRPLRARLPQSRDRYRYVHSDHDSSLLRPRQWGRLRRA